MIVELPRSHNMRMPVPLAMYLSSILSVSLENGFYRSGNSLVIKREHPRNSIKFSCWLPAARQFTTLHLGSSMRPESMRPGA